MAKFPIEIKCPKCGNTDFYSIYDAGAGFSQESNDELPSKYILTQKCDKCGTFWNTTLDVSYKLDKIEICQREEQWKQSRNQ